MDSAPDIDVGRYLERIGFTGDIGIDLATLTALQRAHLTAVPFENLDVYHDIAVHTDLAWSVEKVVGRGRGGWCFEANGAFSALLDALGFSVARLGAAVLLDGPNETIDHLTLEVTLDEPYLVDVGFGDSFIRPLPLDDDGPHDGGTGQYDFHRDAGSITLRFRDDAGWVDQYKFSTKSVVATDFDPSNRFLQTSSTTHFTRKPFATRLLDGGPDRVTLVHDRLKLRRDGGWTETPVAPEDWPSTLSEWFGMDP